MGVYTATHAGTYVGLLSTTLLVLESSRNLWLHRTCQARALAFFLAPSRDNHGATMVHANKNCACAIKKEAMQLIKKESAMVNAINPAISNLRINHTRITSHSHDHLRSPWFAALGTCPLGAALACPSSSTLPVAHGDAPNADLIREAHDDKFAKA